MNRNVEIKARLDDFERVRLLAEHLSSTPCQILKQQDTFFHSRHGRLKLRMLTEQRGDLIYYERPDTPGVKVSHYTISQTSDAKGLLAVLSSALEVAGTVTKTRFLYIVGQTRIHLDRVEDLGDFIELEVVLRPDQSEESGRMTADGLMHELGIAETDLIDRAYVDLLGGAD